MGKLIIIATSGNTSTGDLTLSDFGFSRAYRRDTVTWRIRPKSNIGSITLVQKKPSSPEIFSILPHLDGRKWTATINRNAPYVDYDYSIFWSAEDGSGPYEYDPKIAVKPSTLPFFKIILLFSSFILGLFSILFFQKKKKKAGSGKKS